MQAPAAIAVSLVTGILVGVPVGYAVGHRRGNATCNETTIVVSLRDNAQRFNDPTLGATRVVPQLENNSVVGAKIYGVRRASFAGHMGLENGDSIRTINGQMPTQQAMWQLYRELLDHPTRVVVEQVVRRGVTLTRIITPID